MEPIDIIIQMTKTQQELVNLADMLNDYPKKQKETQGAASIINDWIEGIQVTEPTLPCKEDVKIEEPIKERKCVGTTSGGVPLYATEDFTYILFEEVPEKHQNEFGKWLYGQTTGVVNGVAAIYSWDWERWFDFKTKGTQTYFD